MMPESATVEFTREVPTSESFMSPFFFFLTVTSVRKKGNSPQQQAGEQCNRFRIQVEASVNSRGYSARITES
jgi:hypothetical protein